MTAQLTARITWILYLAGAACSQRGSQPSSTPERAHAKANAMAQSATRTTQPAPPMCQSADEDLQPVQFDIDGNYIASHGADDILEPVWWTGAIYGTFPEYERCLQPFSRPQRLMYALLWYSSEVNNGGHDQFFFNSTGIVLPDAMAALQELKLSEGLAILAEARRRMGGAPSLDRAERQAVLDRLHPDFEDLDDGFYALEETANLDALMTAYVRAHASDFIFHGVVNIPKSSLEIRARLNNMK